MAINFTPTGAMCMVSTIEQGENRNVDLGSYYIKSDTQEKVLITTDKLAAKYGHLVKVPIYTTKDTDKMTVTELKKEAIKKLNNLDNTDIQVSHSVADDILCDLLIALGFKEVVDIYNKLEKWYS